MAELHERRNWLFDRGTPYIRTVLGPRGARVQIGWTISHVVDMHFNQAERIAAPERIVDEIQNDLDAIMTIIEHLEAVHGHLIKIQLEMRKRPDDEHEERQGV